MTTFLVPVDGSKHAENAVKHVIDHAKKHKGTTIHILNVQPSLPGTVSTFVSAKTLREYHEEEGEKAMVKAKGLLDRARVPYKAHIAVGEPASEIVALASEKKCDRIVMGSRGLGAVTGLVLGSVATKVVSLSEIPVTLVK